MAKNLLYCIPYFDPAYGGPVITAHNLANSMSKLGNTVIVLSTTLGENGNKSPQFLPNRTYVLKTFHSIFPRLAWKQRFFFSPGQVFAAIRLIYQSDVVHIHDFFVFSHVAIVIISKLLNKPVVLTPHGTLELTTARGKGISKKIFLHLFQALYLNAVSRVLVLSKSEKKSVGRLFQFPQRIIHIPNVIPPIPTIQCPIKPQILFLGRIYEHKGVLQLLDGFIEYCTRNKDDKKTQLIYAGPDAGAISELKLKVKSAGISHRVKFTGLVTGTDKIKLLNESLFVVLLSQAEGIPTSIVEAASLSKPALVTAQANVPELITYGGGIEVSREPVAIAKALKKMLSNRQFLQSMGNRAKLWYDSGFAPDTIEKQYVALYNQLG